MDFVINKNLFILLLINNLNLYLMSKDTFFSAVLFILLISFLFFSCKSDSGKSGTKENVKTEKTSKDSVQVKKETVPEGKDVKLTSEEQKKLNTFFSNFSEVNLKPFKRGEISNDELINFGVYHNYKNNPKYFEKSGEGNVRLKEGYVVNSVQKYFGLTLGEQKSTPDIKYKSGYYYIPEADGEAFTFSQVEKVIDIGYDQFIAYVNVYTASSGWTGNVHSNPNEWNADGEGKPELSGKYKASYSKGVNPNGETAYTLVDYIKQ